MKVLSYLPHGALPDIRGFAPAIVAGNLNRALRFCKTHTICNREHANLKEELHPELGAIQRIGESWIYNKAFRKLTRFDPYPLHRRAARLARPLGVDLVHAHQIEFPIADFRRTLGRDIPVIVHAHAVRRFDPELGVADRYLAVSAYTRERMLATGYPPDRVEVLYNGVDTQLFSPASANEKAVLRGILNIPAEASVMAFFGRKQIAKGYFRFLVAAREMLKRHPHVYALLAGPTPLDPMSTEQRASYSALESEVLTHPRVRSFGPLPHRMLANMYKCTDIVVSATQDDQHPLVAIEAMASGTILVISNYAGIKESVEHDVTGFLLDDPLDEEALFTRLNPLVADPQQYRRIAAAARDGALRSYDWRVLAAQLEKLYFSLNLSHTKPVLAT